MTIRAALRLVWFVFELSVIVLNYFLTAAWAGPKTARAERAAWLHRASRRHLRIFHCTTTTTGPVPKAGLLVSNHLSYFDILVLSAITPAVFVSKSEVRSWPIFGWLATIAGSIFIDRQRRTHVGQVNREIADTLADGVLVVVFPEGTSTNGEQLLPFRSSLLEPIADGSLPITVSHLRYELDDGDPGNDVCYWGDHLFFPHLIHLLGRRRVRAKVRFGTFQQTTHDRKELANQLHAAVSKLKAENEAGV